jgi:hypothetical protein
MADGAKREDRYSISDKVAIALACGSAGLAVALFLAEKTPLIVGLLVVAMVVLLIYPIRHFSHSVLIRIVAFAVVLTLDVVLGWETLSHNKQVAVPTSQPTKSEIIFIFPIYQDAFGSISHKPV